ncbi:IclR family transcriptional regulator [Wenjunlia tyrosinilytica]|jgi:DNA-binding IclR family transcriptional regulator|nr:IclR family transcriptional regulator [Wenjunlia tyrosinilytica]
MRSNPGGGNAIEKVLAVLEALPEHERVTDIAGATGLAKSTVHRILQSLVDRQFAIPTGSGSYIGGPRILSLAGKVMGRFNPAQHADAALRGLCQETGCTVHFALLDADQAVYAAKLEGAKPYRMPSRVGLGIRLHSTAIGKSILAALPPSEADAIMARTGLEARTPNTVTDPTELRRRLDEVRSRGWAYDDEENEPGILCIAAAVQGHTGAVIGAVSVATISLDPWPADVESLAAQVRSTADEVSTALGAPDRTTG